jgi:hypothetical protein
MDSRHWSTLNRWHGEAAKGHGEGTAAPEEATPGTTVYDLLTSTPSGVPHVVTFAARLKTRRASSERSAAARD